MLLEVSDWRVLLKSIQQRKCILLLGPDVAIDPLRPRQKPLPVRLAHKLAWELRKAGERKQLLTVHDLAHVAQTYEREMRRHRTRLELAVEDFYAPYREQTTQLHRDLAALPFTLCINTTPERFMLNAFKQTQGKEPIYDFYHFQPDPKRPRPVAMLRPPANNPDQRPLIYDLYGSLDEPASLVLTENNLLDFLVSVTRQTPPLHPYVTGEFNDKRVSFLFLGFGFRHWYLRVLLHALKALEHNAASLALEHPTFFTVPEHAQTTLFFESGCAIEFRQLPANFASELRTRFEQDRAQTQKPGAITQLPDAPTAFLCHETRDKPEAERIALELQNRGINVWVDKQSLRGGDDWTKLIPHVIKKQTDYVVVLQSPRMIDKTEGYFKTEIHYALERQLSFGDLPFTIPVLIEPHSNLPLRDLAHLHCIDVAQASGVDELANMINEDWRKRQMEAAA
jgi:hypothetical protein